MFEPPSSNTANTETPNDLPQVYPKSIEFESDWQTGILFFCLTRTCILCHYQILTGHRRV